MSCCKSGAGGAGGGGWAGALGREGNAARGARQLEHFVDDVGVPVGPMGGGFAAVVSQPPLRRRFGLEDVLGPSLIRREGRALVAGECEELGPLLDLRHEQPPRGAFHEEGVRDTLETDYLKGTVAELA